MTFTAEIGKSLTFNTGDVFWLGFCGTLNIQSYFSTGNPDLDTCFLLPNNYTTGFPAFITTNLGRVQTTIHMAGVFNK